MPEGRPTRAISMAVVGRVVAITDAVLLLAAPAFSAASAPATMLRGQCVVASAAFAVSGIAALRAQGGYRPAKLHRTSRQVARAAAASLTGGLALAGVAWLVTGGLAGVWPWTLAASELAMLLLAMDRLGLGVLLRLWRADGKLLRHVAVIGANDYSRSFIDTVNADPGSGLRIVGLYDDRLTRLPRTGLPLRGTVDTLVADSREQRIDVIVVALPLSASERIKQIRDQLATTVSDVFLTADTAGLQYDGRDFEALGRNGVIRVASRPLSDWDAAVKQTLDLTGAVLLLTLLSPLLLTLAVLVKIDSPGPVLFRQPRIGFNNTPFVVFKFRTMYAHLTDLHAERQTTRGDPRVTRIGGFLRRTSLDELPQLLNVLRGEMSLVGPRPHAANTKAADRYFDEVVAEYAQRHRIKPGITGWAQVNGWRGETFDVEQIQQRVRHDLAYVENWSPVLDLRILAMTAFGVAHKNAY